jgi:hypothetical protein
MPFLLPLLMVIYSVYHNAPHLIHLVRRSHAMWKNALWTKRLIMCCSCSLAAVMMISPVAYYGYDIPAVDIFSSHGT